MSDRAIIKLYLEKYWNCPTVYFDLNRKTNDLTLTVSYWPHRSPDHEGIDRLVAYRKVCVAERSEWLDIKKTNRAYAKEAKAEERLWLRRERACTLLINQEMGDTKEDWSTYYWPIELGFEIDWCLNIAMYGSNR